jgi:(p)ppGpp synthase/HD superfamily hydrolase
MTTTEKVTKFLAKGTYARSHSDQVVDILKSVTNNEFILQAGLLHDVLEDTDVTLHELEIYAGAGVAILVWQVTKTGPNEFKNLKSKDAIMIKFADRLANISNLPFKQYEKIGIQPYLDKSVFWKT